MRNFVLILSNFTHSPKKCGESPSGCGLGTRLLGRGLSGCEISFLYLILCTVPFPLGCGLGTGLIMRLLSENGGRLWFLGARSLDAACANRLQNCVGNIAP